MVTLRERGWEGLPPPPVFTTGKSILTGTNEGDPAATPIATSLGLPNRDPEPQIPSSPPLEPASVPEPTSISELPVTPIVQSPSISIATLSDFTIADGSDDESPVDSSITGTLEDDHPIDRTSIVPHKTFYLEDDSVEVLCENTLFRVHTTILSFHSPALRRMFAPANLATAESPNGCPRITSSDTAEDFATLLKMIYFPGFASPHACHQIPPTNNCSPAGSLNGTKSRISPHSRPSSELRQSTRCLPSVPRYLKSFAMHTRRFLKGSDLPSPSERASSAGRLLTRTRSSTSSCSSSSPPHCQWHIIWRPDGV